ncbi:MAG: hypothetical protein ABT940_06940 [Alphaproteobacteria bacterium]
MAIVWDGSGLGNKIMAATLAVGLLQLFTAWVPPFLSVIEKERAARIESYDLLQPSPPGGFNYRPYGH